MYFRTLGRITAPETIAVGGAIREVGGLRRLYGPARWRNRKGVAQVELPDGEVRLAEVHGYEATAIGRREFKITRYRDSRARHMTRQRLVLCLRNDGSEVSLERRKIYQVVPDRDATAHRQLRVVDESGEDYLYPASCFAPIALPRALRRATLAAV